MPARFRSTRPLCFLLVALSLSSLAPVASAQNTSSVTGSVVDANTNAAVAGASLSLGGVTGTSATDGSFQLTPVPYGTHTLSITKIGYDKLTQVVDVNAKSVALGTLKLTPSAPPVADAKGHVVADATGAALEGATVKFDAGTTSLTASTDAAGYFEFVGIAPGSWTVTTSKAGFVTYAATHAITAPATDIGVIRLAVPPPPSATVAGRVVDSVTGAAVTGATVRLASGAAVREASSRADGGFTLLEVPPGAATLTVAAAGYSTHTSTRTITEPSTALGDVLLDSASVRLNGTVVDNATGAPVVGATVRLFAGSRAINATTDGAGAFRFVLLLPGDATLIVLREGYHPVAPALTLAAPTTDTGALRLEPRAYGVTYVGRVVDNASAPVAGAVVSIASVVTESDARGVFWLDTSTASYPFRVTKRGFDTFSTFVSAPSGTYRDLGDVVLRRTPVDPSHAIIVGRVVYAATGAPAVSARVTAHHEVRPGVLGTGGGDYVEVRTGFNGSFDMGGLAAGNWIVTAYVTAHEAPVVSRGFPGGTTDIGTLQLHEQYRGASRVTGRVLDASTREPIAGAVAAVATVTQATPTNGSFSLDVASGIYTFRVGKAGYESLERVVSTRVALLEMGDILLNRTASPPGTVTIAGRVEYESPRAPALGARVTVIRSDGSRFLESHVSLADGSGAFEFAGLAPGEWSWSAFVREHTPPTGARVLAAGRTDVGTLVLVRPFQGNSTVTGRVVDAETGAPVASARVSVALASRETDAAGFFSIPTSSASYPFAVSKEGYENLTFSLDTRASLVELGDVRLAPVGGAFGLVLGSIRDATTGQLISRGSVRLTAAAQDVTVPVQPGGAFYFTGVPAGSYSLRFVVEGYAARELTSTLSARGTSNHWDVALTPSATTTSTTNATTTSTPPPAEPTRTAPGSLLSGLVVALVAAALARRRR